MTRLDTIAYIPLDRALLCECGLIGNAPQCACGNKLGLLQLSKVLDRQEVDSAGVNEQPSPK